MSETQLSAAGDVPRGDASGFFKYMKHDLLSGFFVFLIALPLCLGISLASGYPVMAGIFTAIIGAIVTTLISNSELTIKGPAAGLIVIAVGCIEDFGGNGIIDGFSAADTAAYRAALAVGVAAAILQILFGIFKAGILGEFFPRAAIHGMLAAIGIIIIAKQIPVALGVSAKGEPLHLLAHIPHYISEANPAIALIGLVSLAILFSWPSVRKRIKPMAAVPPQIIVLVVAVILGWGLDLLHDHSYVLQGHKYQLGEQFLVSMPKQILGMFKEITLPDFTVLMELRAWKWVFMFFMIGTLESILSAKAIDSLDPWRRKTNMDRDVLGVGIANLCSAMVGGLPMISEIVRSKANIDNGARTRFADMWHGVFLLVCVALLPTTLHLIPLAALAAMLVYTGSRLAHPTEFVHVYHSGREQLMIFVVTLIVTLATDLLIGIGAGIALKFFIHVINGVPLHSFFKAFLNTEQLDDNTTLIRAQESAVFSNWIPFRRQLEQIALVQRQNIVLDVSDAKLIDHTVMEKLHEMQQELETEGLKLEIVGLESHRPLADHQQAARTRGMARMRRVTVIAEEHLEEQFERGFVGLGATGFTVIACRGAGRRQVTENSIATGSNIRIEVVVPFDVCDKILTFLRKEMMPHHRVTAVVETIEVVLAEQFLPLPELIQQGKSLTHV
ncbi:MAG: SulP family inorganic anion transporter [Pirellulaceae bacterium]|nr:SulP family inorganic anion transporter [Pirellulaceae bacterium]